MKLPHVEPALLLACLLAGCATSPPEDARYGPQEMWVGDALRNASIRRALVVQRTLFPYHFVDGTAALNPLGERDLAALADHYAEYGGTLHLSHGQASLELYAERTRTVLAALEEAGVDLVSVTIDDGAPGGAGAPSTRVRESLEAQEQTGSMESMSMPSLGSGEGEQ